MNIILALIIVLVMCVIAVMTAVALALTLIGGAMTGVPFVAAPGKVTDKLAELCPLDAHSQFYDLGCGDGRFVAAMARRFPTATCIGVEKAPLPVILLWLRMRLSPLRNMRFLYQDFADVDLTEATHIYLYLFPKIMDNLLPKFEKELKPGTRVVSCDFIFTNRTPNQVVPLGAGKHPHRLYVYEF
jgi:hypothetical protein